MVQFGMADDALIRLDNFRRLFPEDRYKPADLQRELGRSVSFWSDLRAGRKSFGEKLARSIEEAAMLAPKSLDDPQGARRMHFSTELTEYLQSLGADELNDAEALLRIHFKLGPVSRKRQGPGA